MSSMERSSRRQAYLDRFTAEYARRMQGSLRRREEAFPALADARSSQGLFAEMPAPARAEWLATRGVRFPLVAERSDGAYVWDVDGHRHVDLCNGFGVHLFGHRPDFVDAALRRQLDRGVPIGFQSSHANEVAAAVAAMTGAERVAFCNTGAEAVMGAIRLARAAARRDTIVVFSHSYHGSYDATLPALGMVRGLPASALGEVVTLEYGATRSLERVEALAESLAAVVVEPVQARSPATQPAEFLRELRALTRRAGAALILDDVLLGFRIHQGGSQAHFGVRADLATFGKILGGGLPIGVIAGDARFLDAIDGGRWSASDGSAPSADKVWFAGTFTKNPLTMAAAHAVTERLRRAGPALQEDLNARAAALAGRLSTWLEGQAMPVRIERFGSLFRFAAPPPLWLLLPHLRLRGVYTFDGGACFLSTAHSDADLAAVEEAVKDSLLEMRAGGYLD